MAMTVDGRGWWAIGSLTAAVLATTFAVPSLVPARETASPAALPPATLTSPAATPSASAVADGFGPSPTPTPTPTPSSSPSPSPSASASPPAPPSSAPAVAAFPPIKIAATDPGNERFRVESTDCPTCASGSRIQYLGVGQTLTVHVRGVPAGGRRQMTIYYTCGGGERPLDVIVNDGDKVSLRLSGNDSWIDPATVTIPIDLPAGDTEIRFFHATESSVDLDQIIIR